MDRETTGAYEESSFEVIAIDLDEVYITCSISDTDGSVDIGGGGLIYDD